LQESAELLETLIRGIAQGDTESVWRTAHKLKTSVGTIGRMRAFETSRALGHLAAYPGWYRHPASRPCDHERGNRDAHRRKYFELTQPRSTPHQRKGSAR
jgi:hypothetical protein